MILVVTYRGRCSCRQDVFDGANCGEQFHPGDQVVWGPGSQREPRLLEHASESDLADSDSPYGTDYTVMGLLTLADRADPEGIAGEWPKVRRRYVWRDERPQPTRRRK